jgi:hypothetical protein
VKQPSFINELARFAKRNVKNIADDVNYLEQIGLIQKKETASKTALVEPQKHPEHFGVRYRDIPQQSCFGLDCGRGVITYDKIALEIAV